MNNLVSTRVNTDYYYNDKRLDDDIIYEDIENGEDIENYEDSNELIGLGNKLQVKQKYIVLSSFDRDWYNCPSSINPFNYKAKIGINTDNDINIYTMNIIKNIVSVGIIKLLLPNKKMLIEYSNKSEYISHHPYIMVDINHGNNTNDGTNSNINNAIGILNTITPTNKLFSEVNYLEYKNTNGSVKNYYNNPISNISILDIKIKTELNEDPIDINDVLSINTIYSSGLNLTEVLNIKTSTYFNNQFQISDIIKIQQYVYRETDTYSEGSNFNNYINKNTGHKIIGLKNSNNSYFTITQSGNTITQTGSGNTDFNDRAFTSDDTDKIIVYEDGTTSVATYSSGTELTASITHTLPSAVTIYLKSSSTVSHYNNIIQIGIPHTISTNTCSIVEDSWWTSLKSKSSTEDDSSSSDDSGGKLINTYLQTHLFINIGYLEHENIISSQLI
tara:strand:+ start:107 stop:1441 length:1335 start_codon:yes stop_codon:yes gene_type:complete